MKTPQFLRGFWQTRGALEATAAERTAELVKAREALLSESCERRRTDELLRESEHRFHTLLEALPQQIWMSQPDGTIDFFNQRMLDYFGRTAEQMFGWGWKDVIHPDDLERCVALWTHSLATGDPYEIEFRLQARDGSYRWHLSRALPQRDVDGRIVRWFGSTTDISELMHAEESLRVSVAEQRRAGEALRLLSSAVEQSKESILITDATLDQPGPVILFVNPAFTHMTGYTAEDAFGKTPRILQGPNTDPAVLHRLRETLARGDVFEGEAVNYRKDGTEFNMEWQVAPIRDGESAITHFVAIQRDVTRRKLLETRALQSQKMETVGKLAGGIAHEFNSIMTAIIGQSELILSDLPREHPLRRNATEIRKAADRAAELTRQLLAYGRKQILQPEILNLNSVLSGMETVFRHLASQTVNLRIIPCPNLQTVKVDAGQIEQVIMNVVMNAVDAMPNGGKLTLATDNITLDSKYVSHFPELKAGDYVMLAITDTGAGINQEVQARMFDPFYSTKGPGRGTGLGLATCYGILKQSGGHINVYSEPGRGATFKIYLPQARPQGKQALESTGPPPMPGGRETILLVEDDPALREMAVALLQRLGYVVWAAANGIEALNLAHLKGRGHIDLLFTDVVMPHMSGRELADRIRSLSPETAILFTSAYTESAIVHQGVLDVGVALLQKPFTPLALARKVRQMLDREISRGDHSSNEYSS